jgi:hypothetical protein
MDLTCQRKAIYHWLPCVANLFLRNCSLPAAYRSHARDVEPTYCLCRARTPRPGLTCSPLDTVLILGERHLRKVLAEYVRHYDGHTRTRSPFSNGSSGTLHA